MDKQQAQSSIKSLAFELSNLTPSALIILFEIDLSNLLEAKSIPSLSTQAAEIGFTGAVDNVLRFHNNVKVFNSKIKWNGNDYYPIPIQATGFETSSKGTLPTPVLTIASQTEEGVHLLSLLKHEILKYGDIVGCKVTRRRTFAKYLDWENFEFNTAPPANPRDRKFSPRLQELPAGYEPDPNAELPKDVYFIERKSAENKNTIQYQLSSVLDLEGVKIPQRVVISDRCNWEYRGPGCWYQHAYDTETKNANSKPIEQVPVLQKAQLTTEEFQLPDDAPPVATYKNEIIDGIVGEALPQNSISSYGDQGPWNKDHDYNIGDYVYIEKNKVKHYFTAKKVSKGAPPPNDQYWVADACSKTLAGCRLRWGVNGKVARGSCPIGNAAADDGTGGLPFGGFPAARKIGGGR